MNMNLSDDIVMFRYLSLKCLCAQVISTSKLPYKGEVCIEKKHLRFLKINCLFEGAQDVGGVCRGTLAIVRIS